MFKDGRFAVWVSDIVDCGLSGIVKGLMVARFDIINKRQNGVSWTDVDDHMYDI